MTQAVLLGDPGCFRVKSGTNPHTRTRWGRRKSVDRARALAQWQGLRSALQAHGVTVHVLPAVPEHPGTVFPANAGVRIGGTFYLSNLNRARASEKEIYREHLRQLGLDVRELPSPHPFEGEADFTAVGDPSGDPKKRIHLFTHGRLERPRWVPRLGIPPYRRAYGFRSDRRVLEALRQLVRPLEVVPLELTDELHYHGDTVLCPFGPRNEHLLAYLEGLSGAAQEALRSRFGERLLVLGPEDGRRFAANSFQVFTDYYSERVPVLLMPDGLSGALYTQVRARGVIPCPVDVSEFLEKGGGAVKCMLLNLG